MPHIRTGMGSPDIAMHRNVYVSKGTSRQRNTIGLTSGLTSPTENRLKFDKEMNVRIWGVQQ